MSLYCWRFVKYVGNAFLCAGSWIICTLWHAALIDVFFLCFDACVLNMQMPACILGIKRKTDWHTPGVGSQGTSTLSRGTPSPTKLSFSRKPSRPSNCFQMWALGCKNVVRLLSFSEVELIYCRILKCFKSLHGLRFNIYVWVAISSKLFTVLTGCVCMVCDLGSVFSN